MIIYSTLKKTVFLTNNGFLSTTMTLFPTFSFNLLLHTMFCINFVKSF